MLQPTSNGEYVAIVGGAVRRNVGRRVGFIEARLREVGDALEAVSVHRTISRETDEVPDGRVVNGLLKVERTRTGPGHRRRDVAAVRDGALGGVVQSFDDDAADGGNGGFTRRNSRIA